jgi:hypothetical protein
VQRNNEVDAKLQALARQLVEISSVRDAQRQMLVLIESLNNAVVTSERRLMKTITTTTTTVTEASGQSESAASNTSGNNLIPLQPTRNDRSDTHAPATTSTITTVSTESVSKLKLEFSRFQRKEGCVQECACTCHQRRRFRSPLAVQRFLGEVFLGLSSLPLFAGKCSDSRCIERTPFSATMTYYFPSFLLSRMVSLICITTSQGDPAACIKVRRISTDFSLYRAVEKNDLEGVRNMITRRSVHPSATFQG